MLSKFWEGLGGELSKQWSSAILAPAFAFWAGGFVAWISRFGWTRVATWFTHLPETSQGAIVVGVLAGVSASAAVVQQSDAWVLRLLEGYWLNGRWLRPLKRFLVWWQGVRLGDAEERWQTLQARFDDLNAEELEEHARLDQRLRLVPARRSEWLPTSLGNVLRAAERRPGDKYGLDAVVCWPRLWLVMPDAARTDLAEARSDLNLAANLWLWGVLFIIWTIWAWWAALAGLAVALFAYRRCMAAATVYGDLLEAAFDVNRFAMYSALRWPLPARTSDEPAVGKQLTQYLLRGEPETVVHFQHPEQYVTP